MFSSNSCLLPVKIAGEKRAGLIREMFGSVGKDVWINQPLTLAVGLTVTIGDGTYINSGMTFIDDYKITIGKGCLFGTNVAIYTAGHPVHPATRNTQYEYGIDVTIGNNVWIGGNVVICPGVTIGDNSVIGAGSVVTKDIPAWTVAAGNPCRVIRKITEADRNKYSTGREIDDEAWQDILRIEREENDNRKYPVAEE